MEMVGEIPSPYGPMLKVMHDPGARPDPDDCYFHNFEDCMTLAGVYGDDRDKCRAAMKALNGGPMTFDIFLQNGGRKVSSVALPRPQQTVYSIIRNAKPSEEMDLPVEGWVSSIMDTPDWYRRSQVILDNIGSNLSAADETGLSAKLDDRLLCFSFGLILTAALEHLVEDEVACIQAAAFYAVSSHQEWRRAGIEWLKLHRRTWFKDWMAERPVYRRFAAGCRANYSDIPAWIGGA